MTNLTTTHRTHLITAPHSVDQIHGARQQARLRLAAESDRPALLALHRTALFSLSRGYYSEAQVRSLLRHVSTLDAALIADQTYFVAELNGRIVACGGWSARAPRYLQALGHPPTPSGEPRGPLIRAMYTLPAYARRGLGRQMLAAAECAAMARYSQALELDALLAGVPLYLAAGYERLGCSTWRLPDGAEIAIVRMRQRRSPLTAGLRTV